MAGITQPPENGRSASASCGVRSVNPAWVAASARSRGACSVAGVVEEGVVDSPPVLPDIAGSDRVLYVTVTPAGGVKVRVLSAILEYDTLVKPAESTGVVLPFA